MIDNRTIEAVKELGVVEVLRKYLPLQKHGVNFMCSCPFHGDRSPSLSVSPAKQMWHCFSCQRAGDAIKFVQEFKQLDFQQAVEEIAKDNGIEVVYVKEQLSEEQQAAAQRREQLFLAIDAVQRFYVAQLQADTDEARAAREYAYSRWPQEFCEKAGIGFAPSSSKLLLDFCQSQALDVEVLKELGVIEENKSVYAALRSRITIPIFSRTNRVIGFTARTTIGDKTKYMNLKTSPLFTKGKELFGINKLSAAMREFDFIILVEGAPDVLRLQSLGLTNAVAALGTAWNEEHFRLLKRFSTSLCFVPDSDPPKDGQSLGPGFNAVLKSGALAMSLGFNVTVKELPFASVNGAPAKNDADSFITSREVFDSLEEKHFPVWYAEKNFSPSLPLPKITKTVKHIAQMLAVNSDEFIIRQCVEQLPQYYGTREFWLGLLVEGEAEVAMQQHSSTEVVANAEPADEPQSASVEEMPSQEKLLDKFNLYISKHRYFYNGGEEPLRLSNFILVPLYHIKDDSNGTRIFEMVNEYGAKSVVEFREAELVSLSNFQQKVGSLGNYIWRAKVDKLNVVKEVLYTLTASAELITQMGWNADREFFAFGNGIYKDGSFRPVDDLGIVTISPSEKYYIPATSKMYRNNASMYQFERMFRHQTTSAITMEDFARKTIDVFGDNAKVGLCFLFASMFRDIIFPIKNCFPILNLFGLKGTGKTSLATTLQSLFIHGIDPPSIGITSIPSMNERVSQVSNIMVVFDEYKNDLDERKIAFLKAIWGGTGQVKKNMNSDGKTSHTVVTAAVCMCGQDMPTRDIALYSRVIHLTFSRPSFSNEERRRYDELKDISNRGNTHLAIEVLGLRPLMESNYRSSHFAVRKELSVALASEEIEDRVLDNWVVPLATFRTLESSLRLPFSYSEMFNITLAGIRYQNEGCKKNTEMAEFWEVIDSLHSQGRIIEKAHFRIRYLREFKAIGDAEAMEFEPPRPVLFLNSSAVASLYTGRIAGGATIGRANSWATVLTYLKVQPSYLGLKQDRFYLLTQNGQFDYETDTSDGFAQRKIKVNRPKALCFDYEMLKAKYSLNLETISVAIQDIEREENGAQSAGPKANPTENQENEFPF